ncbi:unnamed protein product [Toxocara canis]|uniref:Uncharacterized protein n=1 Tax=Toxocara canis TaxID=6265 RepID=A0A183U6F2_TOXCA|nr:unnamed protein product [Toxocara canis]
MKEVKQEADGIPPRKVRDNSSNRRHNGGNGAHTMVNENDAAEIRAKVPRVSVRASTIWEGETPSFDNLVLNHADHLKRLALAKEVENQNRFAALLEKAEQFLDRFEQVCILFILKKYL